MSTTGYKRRRVEPEEQPRYTLDSDEEENTPASAYVPVHKRREAELAALVGKNTSTFARANLEQAKKLQEAEEEVRERERQLKEKELSKTLLVAAQEVKREQAEKGQLLHNPMFWHLCTDYIAMQML